MEKKFYFFQVLFSLCFYSSAYSQVTFPPTIQWRTCLGGSGSESTGTVSVGASGGASLFYSIIQTVDGGYILAGSTGSNDGDVSGLNGTQDFWIVRLDASGSLLWQKCLGGYGLDFATSIEQTSDGGYIVAGTTNSNDGDVSGYHGGGADYWVVKLSDTGNLQWQKCLGGSGRDNATSVQQTTDGGFIIAGCSDFNGGDVTGNHGQYDFWIVKLNSSGGLIWQKSLGGSLKDVPQSIKQTSDGGYVVAGYSDSNDGDVSGHHGSFEYSDFWIVKLNSSGDIVWQKSLGGSNEEEANSIQQTADGGYIVAGLAGSFDGDVSNNLGFDYWVVKLSSLGEIVWDRCYGGVPSTGYGSEEAFSIQQTTDGGYIIAGGSLSTNGYGYVDCWIVKVNSIGDIQWQKFYGGDSYDIATSIRQTTDGGYVFIGVTESQDSASLSPGNVFGHHGSGDIWVVKLNPTISGFGFSDFEENYQLNINPNPSKNFINVNVDINLVGRSYTISDITGMIIVSGKVISENFTIDLTAFKSGVYYLNVGDKYKQNLKIIKE